MQGYLFRIAFVCIDVPNKLVTQGGSWSYGLYRVKNGVWAVKWVLTSPSAISHHGLYLLLSKDGLLLCGTYWVDIVWIAVVADCQVHMESFMLRRRPPLWRTADVMLPMIGPRQSVPLMFNSRGVHTVLSSDRSLEYICDHVHIFEDAYCSVLLPQRLSEHFFTICQNVSHWPTHHM